MRRRDLLRALGAGAALVACGSASRPPSLVAVPRAASKKRVLVLGGTGFIGPPIVRACIARGHAVTMFNRGKSHPGLFPDVETILGDRLTQLDLLVGRDWDVVIDTWAQYPTLVTRAVELLRDRIGHYVFISTVSVYDAGKAPIDENSSVLKLPPGIAPPTGLDGRDVKKIDVTLYGPLKALCEQAAEAGMPGRTTSVRPGLIAGPGDESDRLTYWPIRMARGGEMICPGPPDSRFQFIDVRDLGEWIAKVAEQGYMGVYDAVGPDDPQLDHVLYAMQRAVGGDAKLTWIDETWLERNGSGGWGDFPGPVANTDDQSGFAHVSAARAIAKGLSFRPPGDTAKDALAWWNAQGEERRAKKRPGIDPVREAELLAQWHKASG